MLSIRPQEGERVEREVVSVRGLVRSTALTITRSMRIRAGNVWLGMLTALTKGSIEGSDSGVATDGGDRGHVKDGPDLGAATPDATIATQSSAVATESWQPDSEDGNLSAVQRPQLRQMRKQSDREHLSDT